MTQESYIDTIIKEENIFPVYQPVVSLTKGDIFGYEALSRVRQESAHAAPLPIGEIFQMAEQSGHLWDFERLCRRKALEGARNIPKGKKLFLNVSPNVVHDHQFKSGFTNQYLNKYGISTG